MISIADLSARGPISGTTRNTPKSQNQIFWALKANGHLMECVSESYPFGLSKFNCAYSAVYAILDITVGGFTRQLW